MINTIQQYKDHVITSFVSSVSPLVIEKANGSIVTDASGKEYLDCFAGISVVNAGHNHPKVIAAARQQMEKLVHCSSYLYHCQPVARLAAKLAEIAPPGLTKTFFGNGGAEAIEGALKLARLYTGKHEFLALQMGFHGRSLGALSVTGNCGRKKRGGPYAPGVAFVPPPYTYRSAFPSPVECVKQCVRALEDAIRFSTSGDIAAFIAEPVMGEGGIIVPPAEYFREVKEVLKRHNILFIADEVQSGFGRTGKMFAIEHYDVVPDILVTGKGIADGFPLSGITTRPEIADAFTPGDHLSTFGGNPVSCAAALASIEVIESEKLCERSSELGAYAKERLRKALNGSALDGEVRGRGLMIGVELVRDYELTPAKAEAEKVRELCFKNNLLVGVGGAYGNVVRFQPPLVITEQQLEHALTVMEGALQAVVSKSVTATP